MKQEIVSVKKQTKMNWWIRNTKRFCTALNFTFVVTECVSISAFASLLGIPIGIASSAVGWKCVQ